MRNLFKLALLTALFVALTVTPALAKKKGPVDRTVVDGVTLAEVRPSTQMQPYYPATARVSNLRAEVIISVQVLDTGKVGEVDVLSSSVPDVGFEQSAAGAVKHWRFHPALKDGAPIETATIVRLTFAPPTLRSPEGFVFAETSPRNYAVAFMNDASDRTWMDEFRNKPLSHSNRERVSSADTPPCPGDSRNVCIYNRAEMSQYRGVTPAHLPNTAPPGGDASGGR
jgi:protein TonB